MKRTNIARYLFALATGCGTHTATPPDAGGCGTYVIPIDNLTCAQECAARGCPTGFCSETGTQGGLTLTCTQDHTGRRPAGLARATSAACCAAGQYFALAAHLEAASVPAFERLADELARFAAPTSLGRAARRSARDERRHAAVMTRLARDHGAAVPAVRVRAARPRSLEAFARENAIEGCVKETFGAALAAHQARHAVDPAVRAAMAVIARDELRHAELAWRVHGWATKQLPAAARARVERARARAAQRLRDRELASADDRLTAALGLPAHDQRCALSAALADACG